jgi:hypothetical protein
LGRPLVEALVDRGHEVTASTHRTEHFSVIEALGARPALMDGLDDAAVRQAILDTEPEVIINQVTALSAPSRDHARWLAVTNRLRSEGTKTLMTAAREAGLEGGPRTRGRGRPRERKAVAGVNEPATSGSVATGQLHMPMTAERRRHGAPRLDTAVLTSHR